MEKVITVIGTTIDQAKTSKGKSYQVLTVTFKDHSKSGKVDAKKLFSFGTDKEIWERLSNAKNGDSFSVTEEKDEKGFNVWTAVAKQVGVSMSTVPAQNRFETPEERAARQVYIVRQSSIASAVELLKNHGKQPDVAKVIEVAKAFEDYVFGNVHEKEETKNKPATEDVFNEL